MSAPALPQRVLAFYGDDFTGSTDVMEVLSLHGIPTVLCLGPVTDEVLARFPHARAVGIAGTARAQSPAWMDAHLPALFASLNKVGAVLNHYKICSTFDSAPGVGSIGRALEIGRAVFEAGRQWVPLVAGAPALGRYTVFGHHFARAGDAVVRLDRHPTMSRHPVTPMNESDLLRHLGAQTALPTALMDHLALRAPDARARLDALLASDPAAVLFDVLDDATEARVGELVWTHGRRARFAVGSSGLEYALARHWYAAGLLPPAPSVRMSGPVARLLAVSGSCSPATAAQIRRAAEMGYAVLRADPARLADGDGQEHGRLLQAALQACAQRPGAVIYTALGPQDDAIERFAARCAERGLDTVAANQAVGRGLGRLLSDCVDQGGLRRACVAGGDTSGQACHALDVSAIGFLAPLAPGSPLCLAHREGGRADLEIVLKGGQVGAPEFFEQVRRGSVQAVR